MTLPASITLLSTGIACFVAVLSWLFSRAPGWRDQRYFSLAALSVALYAALNLPTTAPVLGDDAVVICSRLQIGAAALHTVAWLLYTSEMLGKRGSWLDRGLQIALLIVSVVGISTPALVPGGVRFDDFAPLHVTYRTAVMSTAGDLTWGVLLLLLVIPLFRLGRCHLAGVPNAGLQFAALCVLLAMGVNDALAAAGVVDAPYLVDLGFLAPVAAVGYATAARFVGDARTLATLRRELESQVEERTAELGRSREALHRAEKLAALGQFAAGVAHEVNNPSAVVSANLQYLSDAEADALSHAGRDAIQESIQSVRRISAIVRQLLDAGRLAASSEPLAAVEVRPLGDDVLKVARVRLGKRVALANLLPEATWVSAQESVLVQVLGNLVVNAVQAVPEGRTDGRVVLRGEVNEATGRVLLVVEDNGSGMEPEVLRRVFEPFFTTKPFGSGTGLGLAVSRGLVVSLGGNLWLESQPGQGTRAMVELARAAALPKREVERPAAIPAEPRPRLLLVDDEEIVLSSVRRLLEARYRVEVASGVDQALARLDAEPFDLVLCDVMMPAGGGERFYQTLLGRRPSLARRVVFMTGGAVTEGARRFLGAQPQPVLDKPLDLGELARAERSVVRPDATLH
ncbi:MAG TPA: ATP-binding protein [Anaeromyxobacter sp.]|nr:ATP-binding protein [Anaeromyxobacter sp.]